MGKRNGGMTPLAPDTLRPGDIAPPVGLEPLRAGVKRWPALLGAVLTALMVAFLARKLLGSGLAGLSQVVPRDPRFYLAFAALYLVPPAADFLIFRRLWGIGWPGFAALVKKRIMNDVVLGYSGEAYFYAWARTKAKLVAAPFGAVKDVTILSAIAGNTVTLATIAVALPLAQGLLTPGQFKTGLWSTGILIAMSLPFLIFSRRVFSLGRGRLWEIYGIHCARLIAGSTLITLAWFYALPGVPLGILALLAAGRLLTSRLPFVPNREALFPVLAALVISEHGDLMRVLSFTAALFLLTHLAFLLAFGVGALLTRRKA